MKRKDPGDMEAFFVGYRVFITPYQLLKHIQSQCEQTEWEREVLSVMIQTLMFWTESFPEDFCDACTVELLHEFLSQAVLYLPQEAYLIRSRIANNQGRSDSLQQLETLALGSSGTSKIDISALSPGDVARQMTLLEFSMLYKIQSADLMTPSGRENSPAIQAIIERFNCVSRWVATEILLASHVKKRVTLIKQFILIAQACLDLHNFNTMLEITAGLNCSFVLRLRKTWKVRSMLPGILFLSSGSHLLGDSWFRLSLQVH